MSLTPDDMHHPGAAILLTHIPQRVIDRIDERSSQVMDDGHIFCDYSVGSHGYPQVGWEENGQRFVTTVIKVLWVYHKGPVPEGLTIDHIDICKDKECINLDHARLLTNFENARRTRGRDWPVGYCIRGHPNSELVWESNNSGGRWRCRICKRDDLRAWRQRNREEFNRKQREYRASKK